MACGNPILRSAAGRLAIDRSMSMRILAKLYIAGITIGGIWAAARAISIWHSEDPMRFACYLLVAIMVSGLKVNLPGFKGTMSVNFLFILIGMSEMGVSETLVLGCLGTLAQCLYKSKQPVKGIRVIFSGSNMAIAFAACYAFWGVMPIHTTAALLLATSIVFFVLNTAPIAVAIALTVQKPLAETWRGCYFWSFP